MSDALVVRSFAEGQELARNLKQSMLVPEALRGKEADILFIVLTGSEMGMGPMKSLQAFESIKGRVGMRPVYMLGMVRAHPSILSIDFEEDSPSATKAVLLSVRKSNPNKVLRTEFTLEDAKVAGLTSSEMYRKWPARMLGWRCVAIHCREHHSDITGGHYTSEEVESFGEKEVNPAPVATTPQNAAETIDALKASIRRVASAVVEVPKTPPRRNLMADEPTAAPRTPEVESDETVGWGKNAHLRLADLEPEKLAWYLDDAEKKSTVDGPEREMWTDRLARYTAELERRDPSLAFP